ncbi:hypothetical protein KM043_011364 [Ampulex compressa]|nr:hypothetical protein KM043_011364 [Ampulex compressa]
MFEIDPDEGVPYFLQCIQQYKQILDETLVWNKQDWVGMILFGTKKWDMDPETKNILTLQKLDLVFVDNLKEIMKIEDGGWEYYREISTSESYPLHDVLWHAALAFSSIKITMATRRATIGLTNISTKI